MSRFTFTFTATLGSVIIAIALGLPSRSIPASAAGRGVTDAVEKAPGEHRAEASAPTNLQKIKKEADFIVSCQYYNPGQPGHGGINDVPGNPTWIVPRENANAILGLLVASDALGDSSYGERAEIAADYLVRVQDKDGAWFNQYSYATPGDPNQPTNQEAWAKSVTQTAQVMIALYKLGYRPDRYKAMQQGAQYLIACRLPANKGGLDDGLLGGGKDPDGKYRGWRFTDDNAYAYWALKEAQIWAGLASQNDDAGLFARSARAILGGVNRYLFDPASGAWWVAVDDGGNRVPNAHLTSCTNSNSPQYPSWIQYSPQMLNLPATGVGQPAVSEWMRNTFFYAGGVQPTDLPLPPVAPCAGCLRYECGDPPGLGLSKRVGPGDAFQAAIAWLSAGRIDYANAAIQWAEGSGIWDVGGGFREWIEIAPQAGKPVDQWMRFIDTSFYAIASWTGGYYFGPALSSTSAASLIREGAVAPDSIATAFGSGLPATKENAALKIIDSAGAESAAGLFFVSPGQINYLIPAGVALGPAVVKVTDRGNIVATGTLEIQAVAPGLFAANANGKGVAAANVQRNASDGSSSISPVYHFDPQSGTYVPTPIDLVL